MIANVYSVINRTAGYVTLTCLSTLLFMGVGSVQLSAQCNITPGGPVTLDADVVGESFLNAAALISEGWSGSAIPPCSHLRYFDGPGPGASLLAVEEAGVDPGLVLNCGVFTIYVEQAEDAAGTNAGNRVPVTVTVNDPVLDLPAAGLYDNIFDCGVNPATVDAYLTGLQNTIADNSNSNCSNIDADLILGSADTIFNGCVGTQREVQVQHTFSVSNNNGIVENYEVVITYVDNEAPEWDDPTAGPLPDNNGIVYQAAQNRLIVTLNCNDPDFAANLADWQAWEPTATDNCNQSTVAVSIFDTDIVSPGCPAYERQITRFDATDGCATTTGGERFRLWLELEDDVAPAITSSPSDTVDVFTDPPGIMAPDVNCEFDFAGTDLLEIEIQDCNPNPVTATWFINIETTGSASPDNGTGLNADPVLGVGEYSITYMLNDGCNTNDTTIYIRVINNNGLEVTCPANIGPLDFLLGGCDNEAAWNRPDVIGFCSGVYEDYFVDATIVNQSNMDSSNVVVDPIGIGPNAPSSIVKEGLWEVVYYFEDELGDTYTCSFNITVEDDRAAEFVTVRRLLLFQPVILP